MEMPGQYSKREKTRFSITSHLPVTIILVYWFIKIWRLATDPC